MCYAIPGEVIKINGDTVTVEYFGQKKNVRNEFYKLELGDYVYAQGGLVIQKISAEEAIPTLEIWHEFFVKLQEIDLRITDKPKNLYQRANHIRRKNIGNSCCIHGIIEFSNYCRCNCLYCGIRKGNNQLKRYRMSAIEIVNACDYAVNELNFKALVLQSGEDLWYDGKMLVHIVEEVRKRCPVLIVISIGERDIETYRKLYQAGARGVLLRFETSRRDLYERIKPDHHLDDRLNQIGRLRGLGYLVMTGFLIGLPGQTEQDILNDIRLTNSLKPEMFSFGPFIPHPQTPFSDASPPPLELVLQTIARCRILYPKALIPVTTALETLNKKDGARKGLLSGANSIMINLTPERYRNFYEIYPDRPDLKIDIKSRINRVIKLLQEIGRAPTDLGLSEL